MNEFYEFRKSVLRNHNTVRLYRRSNCDDLDIKQELAKPIKEEAEEFLIDVIDYDDSQMEIKEEEGELAPSESLDESVNTIKDVDVYHVDGELKSVVVKPNSRPVPVKATAEKRIKNEVKDVNPITVISVSDTIFIKKQQQHRVSKPPLPVEKPGQLPQRNSFLVVTCSACNAVFRNRKNLLLHMKNDHPEKDIEHNKPCPKIIITPTKRSPQSNTDQNVPHITLYKCTQCNSSFIHEANFKQHLKSCKLSALAKLDKSQITIKRTKNVVPKKQLYHNDPKSELMFCSRCPSTYKSKYFLHRHLLEVHNIRSGEEVFYCQVCQLNYSCAEDLKLHNQALHPFRCNKCGEDFRQCMHSQQNIAPIFYENKVKTN